MIKLRDLLCEKICEGFSFKDLLRSSDPARLNRSKTVSNKSLGVRSLDELETWNFSYKSNPSSTGKRHQGYIKFNKENVDMTDNPADLEIICDCNCEDMTYNLAYRNNQNQITPIGSTAINKSSGQKPTPEHDHFGLCKHLGSLARFLNETTIQAPTPEENIPQSIPKQRVNTKQQPVPITKEPIINPTSDAPTPEDSHSIEPKIIPPVKKEVPPQKIKTTKPTGKEAPQQKEPEKIGDTYSDENEITEINNTTKSIRQKIEEFIKKTPSFNVSYPN